MQNQENRYLKPWQYHEDCQCLLTKVNKYLLKWLRYKDYNNSSRFSLKNTCRTCLIPGKMSSVVHYTLEHLHQKKPYCPKSTLVQIWLESTHSVTLPLVSANGQYFLYRVFCDFYPVSVRTSTSR